MNNLLVQGVQRLLVIQKVQMDQKDLMAQLVQGVQALLLILESHLNLSLPSRQAPHALLLVLVSRLARWSQEVQVDLSLLLIQAHQLIQENLMPPLVHLAQMDQKVQIPQQIP